MENELSPLLPSDIFTFSCAPAVSCFNDCCKDLNQFLTPYDALRLKRHFKMSSGDFINTYASFHVGPGSGLPVLSLKTDYALNYKCPFNTDAGCSVYDDRPSSCRMYPLARVVTRSQKTGHLTEYYFLIEEDHCRGFDEGKQWTYAEWIANQNLEPYNQMNDLLMDSISLKKIHHPEPLDEASVKLFKLALYDTDAFRTAIFGQNILGKDAPDQAVLAAIQTDDSELLRFGFRWVAKTLFGKSATRISET